MLKSINKRLAVSLIILFCCLYISVVLILFPRSSLEEIKKNKELIVLTRNAPTTYYEGRDGKSGFEYDLTQAFAKSLGVDVRYEVLDSIDAIMKALNKGQGHLAAAGITRLKEREEHGLFAPQYMMVREQVVCNRKNTNVKQASDLLGLSLLIADGSSYDNTLQKLQQSIAELKWQVTQDLSTEQILEQVWLGQVDCTVADSNVVSINRRYYPELDVSFNLTEPQALAWLLPKGETELQKQLQQWTEQVRSDGLIKEIYEYHYAYAQVFDYVDTKAYKRRIDKRLPSYRTLFEQAVENRGISWTLLAAQAYQESHWNPKAKSPTGVRGIMMLTRNTAHSLGIKDRIDPEQSIRGGARYLQKMIKRIPKTVLEVDRVWFALAAYNVGMGHIHDAQKLARELGKDPNKWSELREVLPLLTQKRYYKKLKYGYARGMEPVRYVQRIRNYQDILQQHLKSL